MEIFEVSGQPIPKVPLLHQSNGYNKRKLRVCRAQKCIVLVGVETVVQVQSSKFKVHLSESPHMGIQNTTAKREQHAHSDEIVQQYNIMSTQVVSGAVTSGGTKIPESSSKLRHGHLRHDSIHTMRHHNGTETKFHWPLFLISSHIGRGLPHKQKH